MISWDSVFLTKPKLERKERRPSFASAANFNKEAQQHDVANVIELVGNINPVKTEEAIEKTIYLKKVLSRLTTCEETHIYQFITNSHASFSFL